MFKGLRSFLSTSSVLAAGAAALFALTATPDGSLITDANAVPPCQATPEVVFQDNFKDLSQWNTVTSSPVQPTHTWSICKANVLCSDSAGSTAANYYNRIDSNRFSLAEAESAQLKFRTKYDLSANGLFQVFIDANDGIHRSLIADFNGREEDPQNITIPIPEFFVGRSNLSIQFQLASGQSGGDGGALVDQVKVIARVQKCKKD